jgi:hypothetical protein
VECEFQLHFSVISETTDSKASARSGINKPEAYYLEVYVKRGKLRVGCWFATLPIAKSAQMLPRCRQGLTNLWHACPK